MKLLTLTQPWATLVALGAKRIETRPKQTAYTGPIAIHAAKGLNGICDGADELDLATVCGYPFIHEALTAAGYTPGNLPRGRVVAVAQLVRCTRMTPDAITTLAQMRPAEYAFGHYAEGRWAWVLEDIRQLERPYPLRGQQWLADIDAADRSNIARLIPTQEPA